MQSIELSNGVMIPVIGYGTYKAPDSEITIEGVKKAAACGYRLIDTAAVYANEVSVGRGIAACSIPREEMFVTSKVWNTKRGYETTLAAFDVFDFEISADDMKRIDALENFGGSGHDPDKIDF